MKLRRLSPLGALAALARMRRDHPEQYRKLVEKYDRELRSELDRPSPALQWAMAKVRNQDEPPFSVRIEYDSGPPAAEGKEDE